MASPSPEVEMAIGLLIGRGMGADAARAELAETARAAGMTVEEYAGHVVREWDSKQQ